MNPVLESNATVRASVMRVERLRVTYGKHVALHDVDMIFPAGQVTAIIGPSGCGKTTLLSTLNRMSELTPGCRVDGRVLLDEAEVLQMDAVLLRRRVGMVFQRPNPFPLSIRDNVLYGVRAASRRVSESAVLERSLRRAALWEETKGRLGQHAFGLSLGQQQRLCLARCLAVDPAIVLMDEPTASLDPTSSARIEASIVDLKATYTVVLVTHNLQQARRVADRTAFMYEGRLVEVAATERLFTQPQQELTWKYLNGTLA